jgi:hypothetical protein
MRHLLRGGDPAWIDNLIHPLLHLQEQARSNPFLRAQFEKQLISATNDANEAYLRRVASTKTIFERTGSNYLREWNYFCGQAGFAALLPSRSWASFVNFICNVISHRGILHPRNFLPRMYSFFIHQNTVGNTADTALPATLDGDGAPNDRLNGYIDESTMRIIPDSPPSLHPAQYVIASPMWGSEEGYFDGVGAGTGSEETMGLVQAFGEAVTQLLAADEQVVDGVSCGNAGKETVQEEKVQDPSPAQEQQQQQQEQQEVNGGNESNKEVERQEEAVEELAEEAVENGEVVAAAAAAAVVACADDTAPLPLDDSISANADARLLSTVSLASSPEESPPPSPHPSAASISPFLTTPLTSPAGEWVDLFGVAAVASAPTVAAIDASYEAIAAAASPSFPCTSASSSTQS